MKVVGNFILYKIVLRCFCL